MPSEQQVLTLNVPVPDGVTTEATFMVLVTQISETSPSNAKTSALWTYQDGSENSKEKEQRTEVDSVQWSISGVESQKPTPNMPLSHSGCWCNS